MKAERAKWEAEVEELKREAAANNATKKPSAKQTAQQQVSAIELVLQTSPLTVTPSGGRTRQMCHCKRGVTVKGRFY